MSIFIAQEPTQMNTAYTKLMYTVASSNINLPQYKFVCDVLDYNDNLISRLKQPANTENYAVFNVAVPVRAHLDEDQTFYITDPTASIGKDSPDIINSVKQFKVKFGEEYGTSTSSSVVVYDGNGAVGNPAVSGSQLQLNRAVWEPWNEQQFLSSSAGPVYANSGTGSFNFLVKEQSGGNFVDINLRVNGAYVPASLFGGSGSFAYSASTNADLSNGNGYYDLAITSFGVSSSAHRYRLEVYNMSTNQFVYQTSQGSTLPSGYMSASVGGPTTLDTFSFTGSINEVYAVKATAIPTSSFTDAPINQRYVANNYTASSDVITSVTYPLFPGNVVGIGGFDDRRAWNVTNNTSVGTSIGAVTEVYPTLNDYLAAQTVTIASLPTGSFGSWNWNYQDARINFTGSNPDYTGVNTGKIFLTNWPSFVRNDNANIEKSHVLKPIANNDWGTLSYWNISGSAENDSLSRAMQISLYSSSLGSPFTTIGAKTYSEAQLDALTPLLTQSGSGADIPFVTVPAAPRNVPDLYPATSSAWDIMTVTVEQGNNGEFEFYFKRDEPCDYETRSNFAFINKWGVWDFIGLNTPTNKNAVINERNEFMQVNADYSGRISEYSAYNRGFTQYYLNQDYKYQITSEPIPVTNLNNGFGHNMSGGPISAISEYYQELFTSPSVFLQVEDKFIPINITNSNFKYRTNIKGQKVYQVTIQYELSNKPRSRT